MTRYALTSVLLLFQNESVMNDKLESFSIEELYSLADKMGLDLPPGLERNFVIEEILEVLAEDSEDRRSSQVDAVHVDEKKFCGSELDDIDMGDESGFTLEERYNETMIHAIVRDPSWAFAFWDVADSELDAVRGDDTSASLFLRVTELSTSGETASSACEAHKEYFDIPISDEDRQWYINLPRSGMRFRIDLCIRRAGQVGKIRVLARSNEVISPRPSLALPASMLDESWRGILMLSGIGHLHIEGFEDEGHSRGDSAADSAVYSEGAAHGNAAAR
jgi:hypothetical protein